MYGQMTAGSWIYIGTQGILQGTYETFAAWREKEYFGGTLAGRLVVTGGWRHGQCSTARCHDEWTGRSSASISIRAAFAGALRAATAT